MTTIRGVALENNQPVVNGVVVWNKLESDSGGVETPTDENGNFTFTITEPGQWYPDKVVGSLVVELD